MNLPYPRGTKLCPGGANYPLAPLNYSSLNNEITAAWYQSPKAYNDFAGHYIYKKIYIFVLKGKLNLSVNTI